jgi:pyruvate kinase
MNHAKPLIIAIDMDGTITTKAFPGLGEPLPEAFAVMRELQAQGHRLVLWTCRENGRDPSTGQYLADAVAFCRQHGIEFVSVNENRVEGFPPLKGRKICADIYIDDRNLGGFPGWAAVRELLVGQRAAAPAPATTPGQGDVTNGHELQGSHVSRNAAAANGSREDENGAHDYENGAHDHENGAHDHEFVPATPRIEPLSGHGGGRQRVAVRERRKTRTGRRSRPETRSPRRTRIVATIGPATDRPEVLEAILEAGVNVARVNLSHGTAEENCRRVAQLRQAARQLGRQVAVLADLPGPKLRAVLPAPLALYPGKEVTLAAAPAVSADIYVTEPKPLNHVQPGKLILLDDGRLQLQAVRLEGQRLVARVNVGGTLLPKKGVNLPDTPLGIPALTARDREALAVAAAAQVDWLGLSFVRGPEAAAELREAAAAHGLHVPVLAKIELPEAVDHAAAIIEAFDGVMMDRGDLGVEIPLERVPYLQKKLINLARAAGKPFITATDMLDSMRTNPRPTRAESNDVANAVYDGTDAIMLSGETAAGQYPVEAVSYMDRIARETEAHLADDDRDVVVPHGPITDRITQIACTLAREAGANVIIAPTHTGHTPRLVARHRPRAVIVAPTPDNAVARKLALVWGVIPIPMPTRATPGEDWLELATKAAFAHDAIHEGDLAVGVAGHLVEGGKKAPTIRLVRVGPRGSSCAP